MRRFASVSIALALPFTLPAQRSDTTMVPRELAAALLAFSDYSGGRPAIVVGRVPAEYVTPLVPRGAAILGGVNHPARGREGARSTTILSMMETPDSALALVQAQIERAGWKLAPMPDMGERGGFAIGPTMPGRMVNYCSDSASLYLSVIEGANRGTVARIMSTPSLRNSMCDPERQQMMVRRGMEDMIRLPTLRPPPGSSPGGGSMGSSSGNDSRESTVRLQSSLDAAEMIAHFAPQLEQQGWTINDRAKAGDVNVLTARKTDEKNQQLYLLLVDNRWSSRQHELSLRVWRPSER